MEVKAKANAVTRAIIETINSGIGCAWRNNTVAVYDPKRKVYRRSGDRSAIGTADVVACVEGRYYEFEVKVGNDRMSEGQRAHQKRVIDSAGIYIVVHSTDEFLNYAQSFGWINNGMMWTNPTKTRKAVQVD
jgi:hypothetical protein